MFEITVIKLQNLALLTNNLQIGLSITIKFMA